MNVLIIDDYKTYGESLVSMIQVLGHAAQYAPSYSEAKWLLDLFPFELALLDFDMPAMTGPTIAAKLTKRFPEMHPVIMSARPPDAIRRAEIGNWKFLQKPLSREVLQDLLSQLTVEKTGVRLMLRPSFEIVRTSQDDEPADFSLDEDEDQSAAGNQAEPGFEDEGETDAPRSP